MSFTVKIQEVNVETITKGKSRYQVANVNYLYKNEARTQKIMSFANPEVFKVVQDFVGKEVNVTTTKNGEYTNWAKIELASTGSATSAAPAAPTSAAVRSTYETPEERKVKQLYIIKQSSISNALEYMKETRKEGDYGVSDILDVAQIFVDWIYDTSIPLEKMDNDLPDVPH